MADDDQELLEYEISKRLRIYRVVHRGMIVGLIVVTASVLGVVHFALGGLPLAGNAVQFAGRPIVTWLAIIAALVIPIMAIVVSRTITSTGVRKITLENPATPGRVADSLQLLDLYGSARFVEFAMIEGSGMLFAVLYHITADPLIIGLVAAMIGFLIIRSPSRNALEAWYEQAREDVETSRQVSLPG